MDRNSLIGIGLMLLLTITYFYIFPPKTPEEQAQTSTTQTSTTQTDTLSKADSQTVVEAPQYTPEKLEQALDTDSLKTAMYGPFSKAMSVENTLPPVHIATDVLDLQIHPQGAQIRPIVLKKFKTSKGEPLVLVADHPANYTAFQLRYKGQFIDSRQLFYEPSLKEIRIAGAKSKELRLRATFGQDTFIEHRFVFVGDKYDFRHSIHLKGLEKVVNENVLYLTQQLYTPQTEKSLEKMIPEVQLCYKFTSESGVERLELSEDEVVEERIKMDIEWFAMKSQFFSSALFASERFQNSSLKIVPNELLSRFPAEDQDGKTLSVPQDAVKLLRGDAALALTPSNKTDSVSFRHYYGPNDISLMGNYDNNFDRVVQLGWGPLRYIALFFHFIFNWLQGFISNYGIIILILAAFIKIALHPLTYRSYLSTAKMQVVNEMPEVKELEKKYADNATELQQKKMAFYNQIGINPMGGCLPLLLQFPILISMFNFFPQSIELRQQAFLWPMTCQHMTRCMISDSPSPFMAITSACSPC